MPHLLKPIIFESCVTISYRLSFEARLEVGVALNGTVTVGQRIANVAPNAYHGMAFTSHQLLQYSSLV
jgi:hypothetical protein